MRVVVNGWSTLRTVPLALALAAAGAIAGGCDGNTSDRKASAAFKEAIAERHIGGEAGNDAAKKALEPIASDADLTGVNKAHANAMLAEIDADAAVELIRKVDRQEMELSRVAFELSQLGVQLDVGALLVTDYSQYDPKPVVEKIQMQLTSAQGADGSPTWEHEGVTLPTLDGVNKTIAQLEGDIAKLQEQVSGLTQQREAALKEAGEAQDASDAAKGQDAVEKFKTASAARKKAAELFTQIDQVNVQIQPLQRQLDIAKGQQQVVNDFIAQANAQMQALTSGWQATQEKINAQVSLAKEIVQGGGTSVPSGSKGASVAEKAAEIQQIAKEINEMRGAAQERLDSAIKHFADAKKAATDLGIALNKKVTDPANETRPEKEAWKKLVEVMDPQNYALREASSQRTLASLYASQAASAVNRINLKASIVPIIQRAGADVPPDLTPPNLEEQRSQAVKLADEAYTAADDILKNILDGSAQQPTKNAAKVERILVQYGWAQVAKLNGENKQAEDRLKEAVATRDNAVTEGLRLPSMPAELGPPPAPPAPAGGAPETPATQPAEASASAEVDPAIKELLNQFADAAIKGDAEAAKAFCQIEPGGEEQYATTITVASESKKFINALNAKFGDAAKPLLATMLDPDHVFRNGTVTVQGDEAFIKELQEEGKPPKKDLVKVDGAWKVFVEAPKTDEEKKELAVANKLAAALPQLTADVEAGKYADIEAVGQAMAAAVGG